MLSMRQFQRLAFFIFSMIMVKWIFRVSPGLGFRSFKIATLAITSAILIETLCATVHLHRLTRRPDSM
jgi:hypothetical protein